MRLATPPCKAVDSPMINSLEHGALAIPESTVRVAGYGAEVH